MTRILWLLGCSLLALTAAGRAAADDAGRDKDAKPAAPTCKVEKGPVKVEVSLKGVFEAERMVPLALTLQGWTKQTGGPLLVQKAIEHGTRVRKGDTLLWLDLERLDHTIRDLEAQERQDELALKLAEKELPLLEQSAPLELAAAEQAKKVADEDLQDFLLKGRAFSEQMSDFRVKSARHMLESAREELRQLEKMYKANDLTEETEELILKRQRHHVEMAAFFAKSAEKWHEETVKVELPRRDRHLRDAAEKQALALDKVRLTQPLHGVQKRLALEKLKLDHAKLAERLTKLRHDRDLLAARAPADGIAYYGRCVHGHWTTATALADRLQRGGEVQPEEVVFTIVDPKSLFVRVEVEEKELQHLRPGLSARVQPTADPEHKLPAKLESVAGVPLGAGKFLGRVRVELPEGSPVVPGMECKVKLVPYQKTDALTVPASAVFTDELDEDRHYVYLGHTPAKAVKREVKVGVKSGAKIEILDGLRAGDEILQHKPDEAGAKKEGKS